MRPPTVFDRLVAKKLGGALAVTALALFSASAQHRPASLRRSRQAKPSPYQGYVVPEAVSGGQAAIWLRKEAAVAGALPEGERHVKRLDRILSAAIAASSLTDEKAAAWCRTAYGQNSPAANAFAGFRGILAGRTDTIVSLADAVAGESLQAGWRDLAVAVRRMPGGKEGGPKYSHAATVLYLLGMPYPGSVGKERNSLAACRYFGTAPVEFQKAVVDAVIKGRNSPGCRDLAKRLPGFLEMMFRYFPTSPPSPELGRLMMELTGNSHRRSYRASLLPKTMGSEKMEKTGTRP